MTPEEFREQFKPQIDQTKWLFGDMTRQMSNREREIFFLGCRVAVDLSYDAGNKPTGLSFGDSCILSLSIIQCAMADLAPTTSDVN
jgi:hypothetical protein